ncbi:2-phospho-L-lactate guanylyltransferase [Paracoccus sp. SSJ]|uniref:2-phospho-L-lactate guanylyltransferase n=1 Tax=Paracoccus simplex TaxID=2086346 RepID=A0ABV7S327_9RHOB|nr:2-phospho-L-lactate guanylyltransferase [Paracoccus sp. SSJ]MDK8874572.1 2-phospho-L-lactate guanylyltransferase [Paracoccus sp. SSJ]
MIRPDCARLVVVPMKDPSRAKTRLGEVLDPSRRARLAVTLFKLTLQRLGRAQGAVTHGFDIATVTASPAIARLARDAGIAVIDERSADGLNAAVTLAADWAALRGYASLGVLPGDLAAPTLGDLLRLLDRPAAPDLAVVCASADGGTNALILPLPARMRFRYGQGSFRAHLAEAGAAGLHTLAPALGSLRHDVDRREDLLGFSLLHHAPMTVEARP